MTERYARFSGLKVRMIEPRILEVKFERPGRLNALDSKMHADLAEIWREVDADPDELRGELVDWLVTLK